jgi:glyoxylase-like metal-dependent hydrolase (beta-lactamase superfamily II)
MRNLALRVLCAAVLFGGVALVASMQAQKAPVEKPVKVADGVWFEQHNDIGKFGSNVAWFELGDGVVVVDTAFPLGAEEAIRNIKETTGGKRIKYAIVTHYHADHSFGTGAFAKEGAVIVAHENARKEYLEKNVENYRKSAEMDPAYARYQAYAPTLTFTDKFILEEGGRRAEVHYYGHAHTTGCIFTWLPKEKIVFTGDACVNGPFNYMGDADSLSWVQVLARVAAELKPETVCPGHGPVGKADLLVTQAEYFVELRKQVSDRIAQGKTLAEIEKEVDVPMWKKWTGETKMSVPNIQAVHRDLTRKR